ncbi:MULTISPECIES: histidine kinase dimerization/phospho-acceptor domain-containing protein [Rheinheimera]|uniref:histidine kinase n=1 Tax=Rheinheimera pacifica TaxID=173990 RepID=A0A1H6JBG9_9GAMM|nr:MULTISPECIES: histidine kinase dimerization/phospho-acceptor domain-containing protein [Rheinheimera]KUM54320.1 histidine kinase [Rheinheimera sp. EpRS3]SEH59607.1 His Kinase A (phospho-acceptor) domain-containing protein [Rheinheimera pacifica]
MSDAKVAELAKQVHDIRKPLNRISMQAELIKLVLENNLPPQKAIEAVDKILQSCQDCSQLLENLSDPSA